MQIIVNSPSIIVLHFAILTVPIFPMDIARTGANVTR